MRGVESTNSYVSENIDIGGEAVEGEFWSKRQCVHQMDVHPHRDVDFTLDENTSMDNMNDSEIQPQLKRQLSSQFDGRASCVRDTGDYCFVSMDDARCVSNVDVSHRTDFVPLDTVFKPLALPASETIPTETNPMKITPAYSEKPSTPPTEQQSTSSAKEEDLEKKLPKTFGNRALVGIGNRKVTKWKRARDFPMALGPKSITKEHERKAQRSGKGLT
ncbi:hypothetical protein Tco_0103819 [Tanacetum coccineum]